MKGQYGPYIKYKSLNATIPEDKDPTEITMEEALILIEKRREYDKTKKKGKKKNNYEKIIFNIYFYIQISNRMFLLKKIVKIYQI